MSDPEDDPLRDEARRRAEEARPGEDRPREDRPREDDDEFPGVSELIGTFLREPSLWPVLVVVLGSLGAFGAALLVLAGVDHNPFAAAALLLLLGMSIDVAARGRRNPAFRNGAKLLGLGWLVALALAGVALWTGLAYG